MAARITKSPMSRRVIQLNAGGQSTGAYHGGDVLLERLAVLVVELLRVVVRGLLRTHVVNRPATQNPRSEPDRTGSRRNQREEGRKTNV
jgi:hypothetical protein